MAEAKLSGMEMMMQSLLRAAGFNPQELEKNIGLVVGHMQQALNACGQALVEIKEEQKAQRVLLEAIYRDLIIMKAANGIMDVNNVPMLVEMAATDTTETEN